MDAKMKRAVIDMAKGKENGYNMVFSQTYNQTYRDLQSYTDVENVILELMHGTYVEVYRKANKAVECEDILLWVSAIAASKGKEYASKVSGEEKEQKQKKDVEIIPRLPVKKAQQVYDACCALLGLKSSPIEEGEKKVIISRKVKEKVKETVIEEAGGMVKDEIKGGLKALISALSTKAKVAIVAGAVTTTAVTTGVVSTVINSKEDTVVESEAQETEDLSLYLGAYVTNGLGTEGTKLFTPVKTGDYEYTFELADIREHFGDWEYMAIKVEDLPEGMAVSHYMSAIDEEESDWIPAFVDSNIFFASCSSRVKVYIVPTEEVEEYRRHMYD